LLSTAFGVLAAILAAIGLYGVMGYTVTRRTNEIGIRMVLGARPNEIIRMVLGEGSRVVAIGVLTGCPLAVWVARLAEKLLFGVKPGDMVSLLIAAVLLGMIALVASWLPARRAARLDPTIALRTE
jgi:ABC-type antimicrobial peptide transport system permease subunit